MLHYFKVQMSAALNRMLFSGCWLQCVVSLTLLSCSARLYWNGCVFSVWACSLRLSSENSLCHKMLLVETLCLLNYAMTKSVNESSLRRHMCSCVWVDCALVLYGWLLSSCVIHETRNWSVFLFLKFIVFTYFVFGTSGCFMKGHIQCPPKVEDHSSEM